MFDDDGAPGRVVGFVRKRAEATTADRWIAEGMRQHAHQQLTANPGVEVQLLARIGIATAHGCGERVTMQEAVPLWLLHAFTKKDSVLLVIRNCGDHLVLGLQAHHVFVSWKTGAVEAEPLP